MTSGTVTFAWHDDVPHAVFTGEIDHLVADGISDEQLDEYRSDGRLVADLGAVTFLDSTGLSLLLRLRHVAGEVCLRATPSRVRSLLQLSGVEAMFVYDDTPAGDGPG